MSSPIDDKYVQVREERTAPKDDRSLGELLSELSHEMITLVREEVALAKTEMSQKASRVGRDVGYLAAGAAVAYAGFLAIVAAAIIALANAIPWWLSALIIGLIVAGIGGFLVWSGINNLKREDLAPRQTLETLQEVRNG
jgi:uncharacterized membrane protein YqjE